MNVTTHMGEATMPETAYAGDKVIQVRGLRTHFFTRDGVVAAVEGLSFDIAGGEMIGLVGESGCGKSTAALSIMRLLPPQGRIVGGEIILNGRDIVPLSNNQMRTVRGAEVAMIFQDSLAALDPTMKVGEQLMEPLRIHRNMSVQEARKAAAELLAKVGIPAPQERLESYPHQFSGGMRQRAMIAVALSCDPKVLIADEPTTALDVTVQKQILQLMLKLRDETGAGIVIITHDVGVVAETCDRVVVMYAGREVESGPTRHVFVSPAHPYTIGLLGSTLDLSRDRQAPLQAIPGLPPTLINLPPGCPFWPRCPRQTEICHVQTPLLEAIGAGHEAACWHLDGMV
jgi:oligopeptide/dipeptide ABC transporter ATP-binding protein